MPPKKPGNTWEHFLSTFKKVDGTTAYRLAMFFIMISVTPLSVFLPPIDGYKPLWSTVQDFRKATEETNNKIDSLSKKIDGLENQVSGVQAKVMQVEASQNKLSSDFTGFQIDFEKFRRDNTVK